MERKNSNQSNDKVKFKKISGGSLYINKQRVKKGETFEAYPEQIPEPFRSQLIRLDGVTMKNTPSVEEKPPVENETPGYVLRHRGAGWWDIYDKFDKKINQDALRKADAEKLLEELEA